jgi:hypothetical protein
MMGLRLLIIDGVHTYFGVARIIFGTPKNWVLPTSNRKEGDRVDSALKLLKAQRSSALKDARRMEAQLARLDGSAASSQIRTYLRYVARMFREHIATLDSTNPKE